MSRNASTRGRRLGLSVALLATAGTAFAVVTTGAVFTSTDSVDGNTFTSGSVSISANRTTEFAVNPGNMAPGDTVTGAITVDNLGSLAHRYAVTSALTGDAALAGALQVNITKGAETVYSGPLADIAIGSPVQGEQAGDRVLAAATSEVLDIAVTLPLSAGDALQGLTSTVKLTFDAEQVANN